jgi:hypothetical protein
MGVDEVFCVFQGADDDDSLEEAAYGGHEVGGAADQVGGEGVPSVRGLVGAGRAVLLAPGARIPRQEQSRPASVLFAEESDRVGR